MNLDADILLGSILGAGQAAQVGSAGRPNRRATIDPAYAAASYPGTLPRVTFAGETVLTVKRYAVMGPYRPMPGDDVLMVPVGTTYAIVGALSPLSMVTAYKTAEPDHRSTTFLTDPELQLSVPTAGAWRLTGYLAYLSSAAADWRIRFSYPTFGTTSELRWTHTGPNAADTGPDWNMYLNTAAVTLAASGTFRGFTIAGALAAGAPGTLALEWAQNVADAANATQLLRRSWLRLERAL